MASWGPTLDSSEDDGDPPWQERQPERSGGTLVVYFPVPPAIACCEPGCGAIYSPATWTSRRALVVSDVPGVGAFLSRLWRPAPVDATCAGCIWHRAVSSLAAHSTSQNKTFVFLLLLFNKNVYGSASGGAVAILAVVELYSSGRIDSAFNLLTTLGVKKRGQRGSYNTVTMAKKEEIVRHVKGSKPQSEVARELSIFKQTVSDYLKQKAKILEAAEKASAELDDDEIVHQICEPALVDSDYNDDAPPAPQPSNADLAQVMSILLSVYSDGQTVAEV
ncbi:hypothetical protein HPB51_028070 [Rhipicephalus microplus]|uniref:HTH psq-type domain-containing protein n=1 Tax=Rhipicephalus microplus TaxID=6941 RepID=A0A9J6CYG4_RHIMP|nr:hypothetical protein HPB51_028070 [Rhipicephalus microplus]